MRTTSDAVLWPQALLLVALAVSGFLVALADQQALAIAVVCGGAFLVFLWKQPQYGILVFLSTFLFTYPDFLQGFGLLTVNNVLGAVFCLLLAIHLARERDLWALHDPRIRLLLAISVVLLLSTWLARNPPQGLRYLDRTATELWDFFTQFAFVVFMIHFIRTREHLNLVFGLFVLTIIATGLSAILVAGTDYRATAAFGIKAASNSNRLGFYSLAGIVILWYLRQEIASRLFRSSLLGLIGMLLLVVFLTGSRSALINTVVFAVIVAIEAGAQPRRLISTILALGVLGLLVVKMVPQENLERSTAFTNTAGERSEPGKSATSRLRVAQTALEIYSDSNLILGVGPGNFRWIRQLDYDLERLSLHNGYLWALLSGGVAGLVLYLRLYWVCWRDLRALERTPSDRSRAPMWMVKSTRTILLLFLIFSLFAEAWLEILPFLIIALTVILVHMSPASPSTSR
jgi:O-antigen ligase